MSIEETTPTLYWFPLSTNARLIFYFVGESNIPCNIVMINLLKQEQKSQEYLTINPVGKVPALKDGDLNLFESSAILRYLAVKYNSDLYPINDLDLFAKVDVAYEHIRQNPWETVSSYSFLKSGILGAPDPEVLNKKKQQWLSQLQFISKTFFKDSPHFVVGTRLSIADLALATLFLTLSGTQEDVIPEGDAINTWWRNISSSDSYRKVHQPVFEFFSQLQGKN